ncbi:MAG: DUF4199 domain-containing protein [Gemmatimonadetes bacterium]|nr:DUF4199 domain-containing protein [Gemmatimonadota bacterium]
MHDARRVLAMAGVRWGAMLGVGVCAWTMVVHLLGWYSTDIAAGKKADQTALVLPVVALFLAIRETRRRQGGRLTIPQGIATGLVAGLASLPIAAPFLWAYHHWINPHWNDYLIAYERARLAANGAAPSAIAQHVEALRRLGEDGAQVRGALTGTLLLSLGLSTLFAVLLRRRGGADA